MTLSIYSPASEWYNYNIKYRRCGKSGIHLLEKYLGLWHNFGDVNTFSNSQAMAHYVFNHSITHFDLAYNYDPSYDSAEETFGLPREKSFMPYRNELFISTKAKHDMWPGSYGEWNTRKSLKASLSQGLKRMDLDYTDIFYSHRYAPGTPLEETRCILSALSGTSQPFNREPEQEGILQHHLHYRRTGRNKPYLSEISNN